VAEAQAVVQAVALQELQIQAVAVVLRVIHQAMFYQGQAVQVS